jgi:hypothetical protein
MSLLWKTAAGHHATPWAHEPDDEDIHDGVESYSGMEVVHPDDSPYHDEDLMDTTRLEHGKIDLHDPNLKAMQGWLSKKTLDHFYNHPHLISRSNEPIQIVHHEDTGEKYLLNGHHRAVVSRTLGGPRYVDGEINHVSDKRRGQYEDDDDEWGDDE